MVCLQQLPGQIVKQMLGDICTPPPSLQLCLAVWQAGAVLLQAWGTVATQFGRVTLATSDLFVVNVQCSMKLAVCFWRGSPCHPTFRSSATCPAHGMGPFLTQGLGKSREVVSWRQNNTYRCGLAVIH